ncbi:hypothetical protein SAMN05216371_0524 [Streptomyces sp. TLI_053]|uniref:hypothetical protein n=1 Tax=Streptomyces sp. TLI_053 TaxID=1855352 RepID=UPI00087C35A3|nr:hypothetical protein [Streptomyces sp. TLI_053]SDS74267.1 hypothetical protein SAMN05216371_0524 [Streptomyces sp. TLI_053]
MPIDLKEFTEKIRPESGNCSIRPADFGSPAFEGFVRDHFMASSISLSGADLDEGTRTLKGFVQLPWNANGTGIELHFTADTGSTSVASLRFVVQCPDWRARSGHWLTDMTAYRARGARNPRTCLELAYDTTVTSGESVTEDLAGVFDWPLTGANGRSKDIEVRLSDTGNGRQSLVARDCDLDVSGIDALLGEIVGTSVHLDGLPGVAFPRGLSLSGLGIETDSATGSLDAAWITLRLAGDWDIVPGFLSLRSVSLSVSVLAPPNGPLSCGAVAAGRFRLLGIDFLASVSIPQGVVYVEAIGQVDVAQLFELPDGFTPGAVTLSGTLDLTDKSYALDFGVEDPWVVVGDVIRLTGIGAGVRGRAGGSPSVYCVGGIAVGTAQMRLIAQYDDAVLERWVVSGAAFDLSTEPVARWIETVTGQQLPEVFHACALDEVLVSTVVGQKDLALRAAGHIDIMGLSLPFEIIAARGAGLFTIGGRLAVVLPTADGRTVAMEFTGSLTTTGKGGTIALHWKDAAGGVTLQDLLGFFGASLDASGLRLLELRELGFYHDGTTGDLVSTFDVSGFQGAVCRIGIPRGV